MSGRRLIAFAVGAAPVAPCALAVAVAVGAGSAYGATMPASSQDFLGMGRTNSPGIIAGDPPDTNGAVGPNHYVQAVNSGIEVWNKVGGVLQAATSLRTLWTGYTGTYTGNSCSSLNDGDPIVRYDRQADRWLVTQFSLPNSTTTNGPSFQCVAVSKTGDPTGQYSLYDFKYNYAVNDYVKIGVWPDAYYATYNLFQPSGFAGVDVCAWDRAKMLAGQAETTQFEQCKLLAPTTNYFSLLPANADGSLAPPAGSPEYLAAEDADVNGTPTNKLDVWKFHVDWAAPANSTLSAPTTVATDATTDTCQSSSGNKCIPQPGTTTALDSLSGRLMDRLAYRNFGDHESLVTNHSVTAGAGSGVRWYELRLPGQTPTLYQQGTFAPDSSKWRWMGSVAQDQAGDMVLGYSVSSSTQNPSIAWAGRLAADALGTLPQTEAIIDPGAGVQGDDYGTGRGRWGDYSSMTVDPADDCTFWYTNELVNTTGVKTWDTRIASVKFPNCAANDFSISSTPATVTVGQGLSATSTIGTALAQGAAETVALNRSGALPDGASGAFAPASITAGQHSTLTLTAGPTTPPGTYPVTVAGTAASAYHATTLTLVVVQPRSTSTSVACAPSSVTVGQATTCTATVSDTGAGNVTSPGGTVAFSSDTGGGSFSTAGNCTLAATATAGQTTCQITYTPGQTGSGTHSITGNYGADSVHTASTGAAALTVSSPASPPGATTPGATMPGATPSGATPSGATPGGGSTVTIIVIAGPTTITIVQNTTTIVIVINQSISCPAGSISCPVTARVQMPAGTTATARRRPAPRLTIGGADMVVPAGATQQLKVKLNARGAALLRRRGQLRANLTVTVRHGTDKPTTRTTAIKLRAPKRSGRAVRSTW